MTPEQQTQLRAPFPSAVVGKLPRVTCPDCSKSRCQKHQRAKCNGCGAFISTQHIHFDYVGHAATTDRLLAVDPEWSWQPAAFDPAGLPLFDEFGGLWIRLTIGGVERLGYGDAQGRNGPNAVKEAIGDAIRNAAMRFGVALDLWSKEDLHHDEPQDTEERPLARPVEQQVRHLPSPPPVEAQVPQGVEPTAQNLRLARRAAAMARGRGEIVDDGDTSGTAVPDSGPDTPSPVSGPHSPTSSQAERGAAYLVDKADKLRARAAVKRSPMEHTLAAARYDKNALDMSNVPTEGATT